MSLQTRYDPPCEPIFLVEDDRDLRESVKELLELEGFSVITAENGQIALQMLQEDLHTCLMLLDLMMPVMDGWQLLDALRGRDRQGQEEFPIVVVSAAADLDDIESKYRIPAIKKPVDINTLLDIARKYCEVH